MNTPPARILRSVEQAAELRAAGHGWDHVARAVGRTTHTVRDWARRFPEFWAKAVATTRRNLMDEAAAEALVRLRQQLRSDDDRTAREAARVILGHRADDSPAGPVEPREDLTHLARYLEGLSDADLDSLLEPPAGPRGRRAGPSEGV